MEEQFCLYNESCMDAMKKIGTNSIDLVLTDPPYNLGLFMKNRATNLKAMRENFFGAAGWDDLEYVTFHQYHFTGETGKVYIPDLLIHGEVPMRTKLRIEAMMKHEFERIGLLWE